MTVSCGDLNCSAAAMCAAVQNFCLQDSGVECCLIQSVANYDSKTVQVQVFSQPVSQFGAAVT